MRVKQLAIIALVGFIGMTSAAKMTGPVRQRLAEVKADVVTAEPKAAVAASAIDV